MPTQPRTETWLSAVLLSVAGLGWWWSVVSVGDMSGDDMSAMSMDTQPMMSFAAFLIAWAAMMAAMMLPAALPVVRRYTSETGDSASPAVMFVTAYLALWSVTGIPAFLAWRRLNEPLAQADPWAGRLAGAVALAAGLYQLTPLKATCLRHCYAPISVSLPPGRDLDGLARAFRAGGRYGVFCLGSCWMLFVLLIALGTMTLAWMLALSVVIWLEKITPFGERLTRVTAAIFIALGLALLVHPAFVIHLV